jgi:hypothetical protein
MIISINKLFGGRATLNCWAAPLVGYLFRWERG